MGTTICKCGEAIKPGFEIGGMCEDCFSCLSAGIIPGRSHTLKEASPHDGEPEEFARPELSTTEILELPIESLELGARTTNMLSNHGIVFIKDLAGKTESDLLAIRWFGKPTLALLIERLRIMLSAPTKKLKTS
jgi:DNA-directed RNA polymerase alpha subunit